MRFLLIKIFVLSLLVAACKNKSNNDSVIKAVNSEETDYIENESPRVLIPEKDERQNKEETRKIRNGSYTADIEYFNTTTGVNTLYVTKVIVEDNYLKEIKWPSGVWLHSDYFQPEKIKKDGTCIVSNIEAGYENRVKILDLEYLD